MGQLWSQTFPPKPKFHADDIPDLSGKVMLVTGGNTGIGKEIVRALLTHNAKVYLAARDVDKGRATIEELKEDTGKQAILLQLDLSSLKSIRNAVDEFTGKEKELHGLFNNGGVMFLTSNPHALDTTEDGYDIQWGTNALGPYYLTSLLIPSLTAGAKHSPDGKARVTFAASIVQSKGLKFDAMTDTPARKKMSADQRYGQSKFANVVMAREFAARHGNAGVRFNSLDPGGIKTDLQRHMPGLMRMLLSPMLYPAEMGALTPLWAAASPESAELNGEFLIPLPPCPDYRPRYRSSLSTTDHLVQVDYRPPFERRWATNTELRRRKLAGARTGTHGDKNGHVEEEIRTDVQDSWGVHGEYFLCAVFGNLKMVLTVCGRTQKPWLILRDPRGASYVLQGKNYVRPDNDRMFLELLFGKSLFAAEGDEYRKMRKFLNPAFTLQSIQEVSHIFFELAENLKHKWEDVLDGREAAVFDIAPMIHMLSLDAISMTMFMHNISASKGKIPELLHKMSNSPQDFWTLLLGALASMFPYISIGKIAEEMWAGKEGAGMHAKVIDALSQVYTSQGSVSKDEAIAQIIGIMFAGSETTANVIIECLYELARNPIVQQKLREEISGFQAKHVKAPGYEDLMSPTLFPYLDAVVRDSLRTKAVLREIGRMALRDDIIPLEFLIQGSSAKELHVKAGQIIQIPIRDGINADEDIWGPDASVFRPERWIEPDGLPPSVDFVHAQGRTMAFGDGPKSCLGRTFAIAEIKIVVASIISSFSLEDTGVVLDFYHLSGNTVKPLIRGKENDGVQLPLRVSVL